jgi:hypothetical protein
MNFFQKSLCPTLASHYCYKGINTNPLDVTLGNHSNQRITTHGYVKKGLKPTIDLKKSFERGTPITLNKPRQFT